MCLYPIEWLSFIVLTLQSIVHLFGELQNIKFQPVSLALSCSNLEERVDVRKSTV